MPAPSNDNFASASAISGATGSASGTTLLATSEGGEPGHYNYNPSVSYPVARVTIAAAHSVWFSWTCPTDGDYFFSTRDLTGGMATDYKSTVQIFTGSAVGSLTSVTYLMDQSVGDGDGADNGASVAFRATAATVYRIQIDGRSGAAGNYTLRWGAYSPMRLSGCSGGSVNFLNEICIGTVIVTDATVDATYPFGTFGADAGFYKIKYIGGDVEEGTQSAVGNPVVFSNNSFFADGIGYAAISPTVWSEASGYSIGDFTYTSNDTVMWPFSRGMYKANSMVTASAPSSSSAWTLVGTSQNGFPSAAFDPSKTYPTPLGSCLYKPYSYPFFTLLTGDSYQVSGGAVPPSLPGLSSQWNSVGIDFMTTTRYSSLSLVEAANPCRYSGNIELSSSAEVGILFQCNRVLYADTSTNTDVMTSLYANTSTPPTFQLVHFAFDISMLSAGAGGIINRKNATVDNDWNIVFGIQSTATVNFDNCTIELLTTGGISVGSSVTMTINGGTTTVTPTLTMTCDPTAGLCTATIKISRNGVVVGTIDYPLYPVYMAELTSTISTAVFGCALNLRRQRIKWTNINSVMELKWFSQTYGSSSLLDTPATFTYSLTGANLYNLSTCAVVGSISQTLTAYFGWETTLDQYYYARPADVSGNTNFNIVVAWTVQATVITLPTVTVVIPYPP